MINNSASQSTVLSACLGLPLPLALDLLRETGCSPEIVYTGERAAEEGLSPRVLAVYENRLIVSYFRDGEPREA